MRKFFADHSVKFIPVVFAVASVISLTSCDSGTSAGTAPSSAPAASAGGGPTANVANPPAAPTSNGAKTVGESCVSSDPNHLCLAINFVTYKDPSGAPSATQDQVATIVHEMNSLWSQCNIGFQVENYNEVDPTQAGLAYGADAENQLDQIRNQYNTVSTDLLAVTTGPWNTATNAWTAMPGSGPYGAVMEQGIVTYGNGIIYAHEFGHYLGLDHVSDTSDLMNPVIYTTSTTITQDQCTTARQSAQQFWSAMLRK